MFTSIDQTGETVTLHGHPAKRIISLVPSQTELLHYLGLEDEVVGITKFCVHPRQWFEHKKRVGGTKSLHLDTVADLSPDLIIGNKEENIRTEVEELRKIAPVWVSDIATLPDALEMIRKLGLLVGKQQEALVLVDQIEKRFKTLGTPRMGQGKTDVEQTNLFTDATAKKVAYLIWHDPYMAVGRDTFIGDMLRRCGFINVFEHESRYPVVTLEQLETLQCEYLFLSSEPFPFKETHAEEIQQQLPNMKVVFVDGEMFSWYGSRLLMATQYFTELRQRMNVDLGGFC